MFEFKFQTYSLASFLFIYIYIYILFHEQNYIMFRVFQSSQTSWVIDVIYYILLEEIYLPTHCSLFWTLSLILAYFWSLFSYKSSQPLCRSPIHYYLGQINLNNIFTRVCCVVAHSQNLSSGNDALVCSFILFFSFNF